jgi:eukaryotic-like serine/threonine-protein kinase
MFAQIRESFSLFLTGDQMDAVERQRRIRALFDQASAQPAELQKELVHREAGDPEIERAVLRLLKAGASSGGFLSRPVWQNHEPPPQEGTRIGPYKVIRELGAGGMGIVYFVVRADEVFRRTAALKVIRPEYKTGPLVRRFQQERQILAGLDHPNIARIVDGGTTSDGLLYFVMDYVEGQPIDLFCTSQNASLRQRLNLFRQACAAVQYLHENRVIHRDLKPANILVAAGGVVKLVDFGIARILVESGERKANTTPLMTPGYASPEQIRGGPTGPATDIYSLGAILYEMLTGVRPHDFGNRTLPEVIRAISTEDPATPSTVAAKGLEKPSKDLDSIVLMALRKEPERRYASAAALAADVERYLYKRPVLARKNSLGYVTTRFIQRQKKAVAAGVLIAASLGTAGWYSHLYSVDEAKLHKIEGDTTRLIANARQPQSEEALRADLEQFNRDYGVIFHEALEHRAGGPEPRRIVRDGLDYLKVVGPEAVRHEGSASDLARAYLNIAELQWSAHSPSLGDREAAAETLRKAGEALRPALFRFRNSAELKELAQRIASHEAAGAAAGQQ